MKILVRYRHYRNFRKEISFLWDILSDSRVQSKISSLSSLGKVGRVFESFESEPDSITSLVRDFLFRLSAHGNSSLDELAPRRPSLLLHHVGPPLSSPRHARTLVQHTTLVCTPACSTRLESAPETRGKTPRVPFRAGLTPALPVSLLFHP